jgi:crotonobetainyl-CoA:carnitine CoA-transferase CaiB-like acyl-CoA transferase
MLANVASGHLLTGATPVRYGNAHPNIVPYETLDAADGVFALALGNDAQWQSLCEVLGRGDLGSDQRYSTNAGRVTHRTELIPALRHCFSTMTVADAVAACQRAGVPAGPVRSVAEAFADPQVAARHMVVGFENSSLRTVGSPLTLLGTPPEYRLPPPRLGEHTDEVLAELFGAR